MKNLGFHLFLLKFTIFRLNQSILLIKCFSNLIPMIIDVSSNFVKFVFQTEKQKAHNFAKDNSVEDRLELRQI